MKHMLAITLVLCLALGLASCGDTPAGEASKFPAGVTYEEAFQWEGDPGEGLSAPDAALLLFNTVVTNFEGYYTPGDEVTITMTGFETLNGGECYLFTASNALDESRFAVDYFENIVYVELDGEYLPIGGALPNWESIATAEEALALISFMTQALRDDAPEELSLAALDEGAVNGQRAWLFVMGVDKGGDMDIDYEFAVTEDGGVFLKGEDGEYTPFAAG